MTLDVDTLQEFWQSISREAQEAGRGLFAEVFPAVADSWSGEKLQIRREYATQNDGVAYPVLASGQPPVLGERVWCARVGDGAVVLGRVSKATDEAISALRADITNLQNEKYDKTGGDITGRVNIHAPGGHLGLYDSDAVTQLDHWLFQNLDQTLRVFWHDNSTSTITIAFTISPGGVTVFNQKLTALALQSDGPLIVAGKIDPGDGLSARLQPNGNGVAPDYVTTWVQIGANTTLDINMPTDPNFPTWVVVEWSIPGEAARRGATQSGSSVGVTLVLWNNAVARVHNNRTDTVSIRLKVWA